MRFIDSNPFIYAFYKPKNELLDQKKIELKNKSKAIVNRINEGEKVLTTTVHISEVYNLLKRNYNQDDGIALTIMQQMDVVEIYSFDSHFDNLKRITRLKK